MKLSELKRGLAIAEHEIKENTELSQYNIQVILTCCGKELKMAGIQAGMASALLPTYPLT